MVDVTPPESVLAASVDKSHRLQRHSPYLHNHERFLTLDHRGPLHRGPLRPVPHPRNSHRRRLRGYRVRASSAMRKVGVMG